LDLESKAMTHSTPSTSTINLETSLTSEELHLLRSRLRMERHAEETRHIAVGSASGKRWAVYAASIHELAALAAWMEVGSFRRPNPLHQLASAVSGRDLSPDDADAVLSGMLSNSDSAYRCEQCDIGAVIAFADGFAHGAVACFRQVQTEFGVMQ
jgi:hypothetical protein